MRFVRLAIAVLLVAGTARCGYPTFGFAMSSSSGSGGTGAGPSSTSTSGGPTCEVKHAGGGTCEYLPGLACGCGDGMKCTIVDETTGESACDFSGDTQTFYRCTTNADCADGAWCNHTTSACQPICVNDADCANQGGGQCAPALQTDGVTPIPSLKVCAAHCDLVTANPCGPDLNCIYQDKLQEFECSRTKGLLEFTSCNKDSDCAQTLGCNKGQCRAWCTPATLDGATGSDNCTDGICYAFNPPIMRGDTVYGECAR